MFSLLRSLKRALENTFFDKIIRITFNKLSHIYFKYLISKNKYVTHNQKFIFINYGGMGDCTLPLEFLNSLAKKFDIILLLEKKFRQLDYLISQNIVINYYEKKNLFYELKQIAKKHQNCVLIQQSPIFEFLIFHFLLKRPTVIGYIFSQNKISIVGAIEYNTIVPTLNKLSKYNEILNLIDKNFKCSEVPKISKKKNNTSLIKQFNFFKTSYFILSPTKNAQWDVGFLKFFEYAQILEKISRKTQLIPVIVGINEDFDIINRIICNLPKGFNFVNLVGKTSIKQLINLIKNSNFVIANDNGIHHLSNFLNKKTLTLFNFSSPDVYNWNNKNSKHIFFPEYDCMPCIGKNVGPFDNYPFKCPWNIRCKETITSDTVVQKLSDLKWL